MKWLWLILITALSAQAQDLYITKHHGAVGAYQTLLSRDCTKVFYLPKRFLIDEEQSSVHIARSVKSRGADVKVNNLVKVRIALKPAVGAPDEESRRALIEWGTAFCAKPVAAVEPYPAALVELESKYRLERKEFRVVEGVYGNDGNLVITLAVDPFKVNELSLIRSLDSYDPEISIRMASLEEEASARLRVSYSGVAEFAMQHYTEQICYRGERCFRVAGLKVKCRSYNYCQNIPKSRQAFDNLTLNGNAVLELFQGKNVPDRRTEELKEELYSRFLLSQFDQKQVRELGALTEVTLGQMRKEAKGDYADELVSERLVESKVRANIDVSGAGGVLAKSLADAFKNVREGQLQ